MANYTPNYHLYLPNRNDPEQVDTTLSTNFQTIDTQIKNRDNDLQDHKNATAAHSSDHITHGDGTVQDTLFDLNKNINDTTDRLELIIGDNGNSNAEIVDSRGGFKLLRDRLDNLDSFVKNKIFKKSVFKQLPLRFPDYDTIVVQEAVSYIYPQSFTMDWDNREIFIVYSPDEVSSSTKRWVVVYDFDANYKCVFHAGDAGGEGIVVKTEGTDRYLYVKTTGSSLGKFLITTLPTNLSDIIPISEYDVGLYYDFSYRNGVWLVEQSGASLGSYIRRSSFSYYNDNFQLIGTINIRPDIGGYFNGSYSNYIPKRQGIALGNGFIVQGAGGFYRQGNTITPYTYQGIKILNTSGELISEGVVDPSKMINILNNNGYVSNRVETESVHVDPNGEIYSLVVINGSTNDPETLSSGLVIFHELSTDKDALDLSSIALTYPRIDPSFVESGVFPRSGDGNMYDPFTGNKLDTLDKILDFMLGTDLKAFCFYSSSVTVFDINGVAIPTSNLVTIRNANNGTFMMDYFSNVDPCKRFTLYGNSGARTQKQVYYRGDITQVLTLESGVTNYFTNMPLTAKKTTEKLVNINGMVNVPTTRPVTIAVLPVDFRPPSTMSFNVALSASASGGYGTIAIKSTGEIQLVYTSLSVTYVCLNGVTYQL